MSDRSDSTAPSRSPHFPTASEAPEEPNPYDPWKGSPVLRETFLRLCLEPEDAEIFRKASRIVYLASLEALVPDPQGSPPAEHVRESLVAVMHDLMYLSGFLRDVGMEEVGDVENEGERRLRKLADEVAVALSGIASVLREEPILLL